LLGRQSSECVPVIVLQLMHASVDRPPLLIEGDIEFDNLGMKKVEVRQQVN